MSKSFQIIGMQSLFVCPRDWDTSIRFWRDTLGLEVAADWSDDGHGAAALRFGDAHVIVAGEEEQRNKDFGFPVESGKLYMYVQVEGLDALAANLRSKHNLEIHGPVQLHWGPRMVAVQDPEGVPIMFVEGDPDSTLVTRFSRERE